MLSTQIKKRNIKIRICPLANKEHEENKRQYAHTYHTTLKDVICVADAYCELPIKYKIGILLHEIGHLLAGSKSSEKDADDAVFQHFGIKIKYKSSKKYGKDLQYI